MYIYIYIYIYIYTLCMCFLYFNVPLLITDWNCIPQCSALKLSVWAELFFSGTHAFIHRLFFCDLLITVWAFMSVFKCRVDVFVTLMGCRRTFCCQDEAKSDSPHTFCPFISFITHSYAALQINVSPLDLFKTFIVYSQHGHLCDE